jgi:hypothetical protein
MKQSPDIVKLEEVLRSSKLVSGGFMGDDRRTLSEILQADATVLEKAGVSAEQLADRMQDITDRAIAGLGTWVDIDGKLLAKVDEAKGAIVCPWPHPASFAKRVTTVNCVKSGEAIKWSDLSIHLIAAHGFFEGDGSQLRTEPRELIRILL